jgi:hypothetical protein
MHQPIFLIKKIKKKADWTSSEDETLVREVRQQRRRSWLDISKKVGKTRQQCYLRYKRINPLLKRGTWDNKEDLLLLEAIKTYGKKWYRLAKVFPNRSAKQIRDRYITYLDPSISRDKFSLEEDLQILELVSKFGNKWSYIKTLVPHRSSDQIKNRYNSSIARNKKLLDVVKNIPTASTIRVKFMFFIF